MDKLESERPNPEPAARKFAFAPIRYLWFWPLVLLVLIPFTKGISLAAIPFLQLAFLAAILYVLCDIRFMVWKMKK